MNLELSKEIEFLFTINHWDWKVENTRKTWKEKFQNIVQLLPSDIFFSIFRNFLSNLSDESIEGIINYFIKEVQISLKELRHPDCIRLSGNLLEIQIEMLAEKRPIHKHWNSVLHSGIRLDRRLFFNQLIECFLKQASSDLRYNIWNNRFHLIFNPPFAHKRNTPGNDFEFIPKVFHLNKISKDLSRNIFYVKYESNHQEILLFIIGEHIKSMNFSQKCFEDFFSLLKDISNENEVLSLIKDHINAVANKLKNITLIENLNEKEISSLSFYFTYLQKNTDNFAICITEFNDQLEDEDTVFKLWTVFRHYNPSVEFLEKHMNKMVFGDYLESSEDFHKIVLKKQIIEYDKYKEGEHIFFGLLVMSMIESPAKIFNLFPINSILNKAVMFYSFNYRFSCLGKCFEVSYEYQDYKFTTEELLSLTNLRIDGFNFIKRWYFVKLLQYEYSSRTERFGLNKQEIGFFKMEDINRVEIIKSCWDKAVFLENDINDCLSTIISTIKSESTLFLGEIIIRSMFKDQSIDRDKILQNIERNAKDEYKNKLIQFVKLDIK